MLIPGNSIAGSRVVGKLAVLLGAACASGGYGSHAQACTCRPDQPPVRPNQDDDGDAPRDTRVWLPSPVVEEGFRRTEGHFANTHGSVRPTPEEVAGFIALIDDDGDFIPFDVTTIVAADGTDVYFVLTPDADLQPGQYAVEPLIVGADRVAFTVGAHTSSDTPQVPEIIERRQHLESGVGNSCGESRGKSFALEHASPFSIAAIGAAPSFDEDKGQWQSAVFTQRRSITVGSVACLDATWDFDDGPTKVSFAAMDLAGTLSDWTEPERVYVEDPDEGWLCAVSPGARESRAMWAALALPLLLAWRRRRSCE